MWGPFGEAFSACPSFSEVMVGAVSVEAVSGGAVLVMSYFGAVSVEAISEWGRFDQLPIFQGQVKEWQMPEDVLPVSEWDKYK